MNRTAKVDLRRCIRCAMLLLLVVLMMLFCVIAVSARAEATDWGDITLSAAINEKNTEEIQITVTPGKEFLEAKKGETLYLFTLQPYETTKNLRTMSPTATKVADKAVTFTVAADTQGERYRAKYVLALGVGADYVVLGEAYVTNPDVLASNTAERTDMGTIKGLVVSQALSADAQTLDIGHAVIPIVIDQYLTAAGDPAYAHTTAGTTTYFDPTKIQQLDAQIQMLTDTGVQVLFRFLLDGSDRSTTEPAAALYAAASADGASSYGITLETQLAYRTINNVFTYFAERYAADSDAPPVDFILGYQVNEWETWYDLGYMGEQLDAQTAAYAGVFRMADNALRGVSANSRVYVPLSNLFASAKPFLEAFSAEMGTDAGWHIAIAPYASDPMDDSIWDDAQAADTVDTVYLTMKNIAVLGEYLETEPFLHEGKMRGVIIDDFAVHGTSGDTASQERQAASFVYAYYKAADAGFIDAFVWHRVIDGAEEHCSLGLRQLDGTEKPVYNLFRVIDSQRGSAAAAPYAKVIGERRWTSIIKGFSKKSAETVQRYENEGSTAVRAEILEKSAVLLDFSGGDLAGFWPTGHVASAALASVNGTEGEISGQILQAVTYPMSETEAASLTAALPDGVFGEDITKIYITCKAENAETQPTAEPFTVQLQLRAGSVTYLGTAELPHGVWTTLAFDVKQFARASDGEADVLSLLFQGNAATAQNAYTISVHEIRAETDAGLLVLRIFIAVVIVLLILVVIFGLLVMRAQIIRRKRRRQMAARRAAMLRRQQQMQQNARQNASQNYNTSGGYVQQSSQTPHRRSAQRRPDIYSDRDRRR